MIHYSRAVVHTELLFPQFFFLCDLRLLLFHRGRGFWLLRF
jgi:hypothetical protein